MATTRPFTLEAKGVEQLREALRKFGRAANESLERGLYVEAELLMGEAKLIVPVAVGHLMNSGHVTRPKRSRGRVTVMAGFGGPAGKGNHKGQTNAEEVGYAVYVHENLTARHNPPRRAKYLEEPANAAADRIPVKIAERIRREAAAAGGVG